MRVALDTNVLAYAEGINEPEKWQASIALIRRLPPESTIIPAQVLGELFNVLTRKAGQSRHEARGAVLAWQDAFAVAGTTPESLLMATDLATDHQVGIWDAVILATAAQAGCRLLLSEDFQQGFTAGGVTVVNPYASPPHPLLVALLADDPSHTEAPD